jgi:hypothetical protein
MMTSSNIGCRARRRVGEPGSISNRESQRPLAEGRPASKLCLSTPEVGVAPVLGLAIGSSRRNSE